jgi:hypothetical protein
MQGQNVFESVGEPLDHLVDLFEDFGRVVGAQFGPAGRQDGDLVAMPVGDAGALEDPIDDGFLRVGLVAGNLGVARDRVSAPLETRFGSEWSRWLIRSGTRIVRVFGARCRLKRLVARFRRLSPGILCPETAGEKASREH